MRSDAVLLTGMTAAAAVASGSIARVNGPDVEATAARVDRLRRGGEIDMGSHLLESYSRRP